MVLYLNLQCIFQNCDYPPKEENMKETTLKIPELALIASTRAMLGAGIALLLADRLDKEQRKAVGWTLFLVGALTTVPLGMLAFSKRH